MAKHNAPVQILRKRTLLNSYPSKQQQLVSLPYQLSKKC